MVQLTYTLVVRLTYTMKVMDTLPSTVRSITLASLLLSLSATSLYPRLAAGEGLGATVKTNQGQQVCCCGTKAGQCCGMACCQLPNPKQDNAPTEPKGSNDRGQPLGLALCASAKIGGVDAAGFHSPVLSNASSMAGSSLIALSIRLNI